MNQDTKAFLAAVLLAAIVGGSASAPELLKLRYSPHTVNIVTGSAQNGQYPEFQQKSSGKSGVHEVGIQEGKPWIPASEPSDGPDWSARIQEGTGIVGILIAAALFCLNRNQIKIMARQTDISERSLTVDEWPYLYVTETNFTTRISHPPSAVPLFTCKILVHGKSPAIIRAYRSSLIFSDRLPPAPHKDAGWGFRDGTCVPGFSIPGHANWEDGLPPERQDTPAHRRAGKRYYAILGVVYDDLFGHMHEVGFCYRGELGGGMGARVGSDSHNYHRIREDDGEREAINRLLEPPDH